MKTTNEYCGTIAAAVAGAHGFGRGANRAVHESPHRFVHEQHNVETFSCDLVAAHAKSYII